MSRNAIIKEYKNYENSKNDNSSIYVTVPTEDNTQKYNKIIMDKLRSISVVIKKHNQKSRSMFK